MTMHNNQVFISVWNCRSAVSRFVKVAANEYTIEPASNWQDLENLALEEVESQGGSFTQSGHYSCSSVLAEKANFLESVVS